MRKIEDKDERKVDNKIVKRWKKDEVCSGK